jgi:hypothetical protein
MITATSDNSNYWLLGWLHANEIETVEEAAAVLSNRSGIQQLHEVAEQWSGSRQLERPEGLNLVAGTGLRLDDGLTCPNPACRRQQVDVLFRHAWHYFDRVLLPDGVGELLLNPPNKWDDYWMTMLLRRIEVVLHIRQLDADSLVYFYPKPRNSNIEISSDDRRPWQKAWSEVRAILVDEKSYHFEEVEPEHYRVEFSDPSLQVSTEFEFRGKRNERVDRKFRKTCARKLLHEHMESLIEDLVARRLFGAPLGATVWSHERVLSKIGVPGAPDVLFRLSLPSLAHVPTHELIAIREQEGDSFAAFRAALAKAAGELLGQRGAEGIDILAQQIALDVIEPELARLNQKLRSAQRALARKTAVSIVLSGLTTTCGFLLGGPIVGVIAGVGSLISGSSAAAFKYVDEKQSVEMSDMYFLWKALDHAG